jgi:hypothetical protein
MAFSGEGASKPFLASGCPFISFFFNPLWPYSQSPHVGLPAITFFKNNPQDRDYQVFRNGCASVLKTTLFRSRVSLGANSR